MVLVAFKMLGSYGEVRKAIHLITKQNRAVKIMHKRLATPKEQQRLINEVSVLKKLVNWL